MTWLFVFEMTWCSLYSRVLRIDYMHTVYVYECIWLCHCANTPLFSALFISLPVHAHMKSCTNGQVVMFMPSHFPFFSPFSSPLVLPPPSSAGPGPTPSTDDSCLSPRPANSCGSCGPAGLPNAPWLQLQAWLQWVASVRAHTHAVHSWIGATFRVAFMCDVSHVFHQASKVESYHFPTQGVWLFPKRRARPYNNISLLIEKPVQIHPSCLHSLYLSLPLSLSPFGSFLLSCLFFDV